MSALGWAALVLAGAWMLVAAKAHGRQLRFERELDHPGEVAFRAPPPRVARLWREERRRFWPLAVLLAAVAFALTMGSAAGGPAPPNLPAEGGAARWLAGAALAGALGFGAAFTATGMLSLRRLRRRVAPRLDALWAERGAWLNFALRGSLVWWGAVLALGFLAAALLYA